MTYSVLSPSWGQVTASAFALVVPRSFVYGRRCSVGGVEPSNSRLSSGLCSHTSLGPHTDCISNAVGLSQLPSPCYLVVNVRWCVQHDHFRCQWFSWVFTQAVSEHTCYFLSATLSFFFLSFLFLDKKNVLISSVLIF